jgi:hypothetical protein
MPQPDRRELDQGYGVGREFVEVRRDADAVVVRSSFGRPYLDTWQMRAGRIS